MNERPPQQDVEPRPDEAHRLRPKSRDWLSANLRFAISAWARRALDRRLRGGIVIPADFFGICVASGADPSIDDYLIAQLRDLTIETVRLDYTLPHPEPHEPRILERLLREGFHVCLHPVGGGTPDQPAAAAATAGRRMSALQELVAQYGRCLSMLELGATVNRRKWYGASPATFLKEYAPVYRAARAHNLAVAAPNVTDFEPVYNTVLLDIMRRNGLLPQVHSDNLFVERAGEPEQYDHKIAGRYLAGRLKFDLLRKARILHAVSRWAGVRETISTHAAWSLRRIARFCGDIEQKQADYVSRYCILAAVAGVLRHMYWGPLIGQREGLIDDGTDFYPPHIPHVTRYTRVAGKKEDFRRRPAWYAFREVVRRLRGAQFVKACSCDPELFILEFKRPEGILHITWTRDGRRAWTADIYAPEQTAAASGTDRDGRPWTGIPALISESPTFWWWPAPFTPAVRKTARVIPGIRFPINAGASDYQRLTPDGWTGIAVMDQATGGAPPDAAVSTILPPPTGADAYMRNARNQVWQQTSPWAPERRVVVKRLGAPRGIRRVLQFFKPTRARRSWNGAVELLRRGLPTPAPVAFLERRQHSALNESYYVCEALDTPHSVRTVFNAYENSDGNPVTADIPQPLFFKQLARFLAELHGKGVYFRDLSAGNILVIHGKFRESTAAGITFSLIDTARARFFRHPLDPRRRLCDLMRICHPLDDKRRKRFLAAYLDAAGIRYRHWMEIPFRFYNAKIRLKKIVRGGPRPLPG